MSRPLARIGLSLPVIAAAVFVLFAAGTWLGGQYLVPEGQGLAGPAEALGYGLVAGLLGLALSIIAAIRLPMKALVACALAGTISLAVLVSVLVLAARTANPGPDDRTNVPNPDRVPTQPVPTGEDETR